MARWRIIVLPASADIRMRRRAFVEAPGGARGAVEKPGRANVARQEAGSPNLRGPM